MTDPLRRSIHAARAQLEQLRRDLVAFAAELAGDDARRVRAAVAELDDHLATLAAAEA